MYVNNLDNATDILNKQKKNSVFESFCQKRMEKNLPPLQSLLIQPIQRIPRYKLLLAEVIKNTDEDHPDMQIITGDEKQPGKLPKAFDVVSTVAKHINDQVRESENRGRIREIEARFVATDKISLISPSRRYIRQGILTKQCRKKDQPYEFFLFSDM